MDIPKNSMADFYASLISNTDIYKYSSSMLFSILLYTTVLFSPLAPVYARPVNSVDVSSSTDLCAVKAQIVKRSETGPVIDNFPDPSIIEVDGTWYAFGTGRGSTHVSMARSSDFATWEKLPDDAFPAVPGWVDMTTPNTWAPDVVQVDDGSFVMYFAESSPADTSKHCIGAATSASIIGPYAGLPNPLFCPLAQGGAIDPSWFVDTGGQRYITYKIDGNSLGHGGPCSNAVAPYVPTPIMLQAVMGDGVTLQGGSTQILDNDGAGDTGVVEAPSLVKAPDDTYVLFFSSGCFQTDGYTVNYATSTAVGGPYTRGAGPLFTTGVDGLEAPGGADVWNDAMHMVFHAGKTADRSMYTAVVTVSGSAVTA